MCGIAGYVGPPIRGKLEDMAARMIHRGPDDDGFFHDATDRVHLCMRRLSIVDLALGKQPKYNADKSVAVMFNGEIYNYLELRAELLAKGYKLETHTSDTEVIAHLYDEYGISFVERLIGMFAIALYDAGKGTLFLIRDRLGKKPIYYRLDGEIGSIEFASEFPVLRSDRRVDHVDRDSLAWYFSQKTTPSDRSIDDRIRRLPPGCSLRFDVHARTSAVSPYWTVPTRVAGIDEGDSGAERASHRLEELLGDSVRLRMRADVEVGAFLSGGVDSSLIVALASRLTDKPLKTYCLVYEQEINEKSSDRRYAQMVSERFGTRHTQVTLTPSLLMAELPKIVAHYGQPNSAVISNWFISRVMGKELKVALSGDGADELFGSYFLHRVSSALDAFRHGRNESLLSRSPPAEAAFVRDVVDEPFARIVDRFGVFREAEIARLLRPAGYRPGRVLDMLAAREAQLTATDPLARMLEFDCRNLLVDQILNYSDVLSMAHSLEVRTPFLDHRLVEWAFSIPSTFRIRNGETKHVLKRLARRYLPDDLIDRRKEGFVEPAVYWIAREMKDFTLSYLRTGSFNRLGLVDAHVVDEVVDRFYATGAFLDGKKVWNLLMYALWEQHYVG